MSADKPRRRNPAAAANGRLGGRPRKGAVRQIDARPAFVVRDGDEFALVDATGVTIVTATIITGTLRLTRAEGGYLTLVVSE